MTPDVKIVQNPDDPAQQVVTFEPPVASWSFSDGHTLEELWKELIQASSALLQDHLEDPFDEAMQKKVRVRLVSVLVYWKSQGWVTFNETPQATPSFLDAPATSTES